MYICWLDPLESKSLAKCQRNSEVYNNRYWISTCGKTINWLL